MFVSMQGTKFLDICRERFNQKFVGNYSPTKDQFSVMSNMDTFKRRNSRYFPLEITD